MEKETRSSKRSKDQIERLENEIRKTQEFAAQLHDDLKNLEQRWKDFTDTINREIERQETRGKSGRLYE